MADAAIRSTKVQYCGCIMHIYLQALSKWSKDMQGYMQHICKRNKAAPAADTFDFL